MSLIYARVYNCIKFPRLQSKMLYAFISLLKTVLQCLISSLFVFVGLHVIIGTTFKITRLLRQNLKFATRLHSPDAMQIKCIIIVINAT